jgi:hypothetical protein
MYAQAEKPEEKSRVAANSVTQKRNDEKQGFGLVDNRPEAVTQRKLRKTLRCISLATNSILKGVAMGSSSGKNSTLQRMAVECVVKAKGVNGSNGLGYAKGGGNKNVIKNYMENHPQILDRMNIKGGGDSPDPYTCAEPKAYYEALQELSSKTLTQYPDITGVEGLTNAHVTDITQKETERSNDLVKKLKHEIESKTTDTSVDKYRTQMLSANPGLNDYEIGSYWNPRYGNLKNGEIIAPCKTCQNWVYKPYRPDSV